MHPYQIILTTCPSPEIAEQIAQVLVGEGLAACVNILPPMRSIYTWRDTVESATEHLLVIKCLSRRYADIETRLRAMHPYEIPEIIALPIVQGLPDYLTWLNQPDKT